MPDVPADHPGDAALTTQYEQLRGGVLAGQADGWRRGLAVLSGQGLAAWMQAVRAAQPPTRPATAPPAPATRPAPPGPLAGDLIAVLAQMALAHS